MSKKSYKKLQNRLYREIKKRIIAENILKRPSPYKAMEKRVETVKAVSIIPCGEMVTDDFVKQDLVRRIANKLYQDDYIEFYTEGQLPGEPIYGQTRFEARLKVVRP